MKAKYEVNWESELYAEGFSIRYSVLLLGRMLRTPCPENSAAVYLNECFVMLFCVLRFVRSSWHDYDVEFGYLQAKLLKHQDGMEKSAVAQHLNDYQTDSVQNKDWQSTEKRIYSRSARVDVDRNEHKKNNSRYCSVFEI